MSLKLDEKRQEIYLELRAPLSNFRITPYRPSDVDAHVGIMNDPTVISNLISPPYPYGEADGNAYSVSISYAISYLPRPICSFVVDRSRSIHVAAPTENR